MWKWFVNEVEREGPSGAGRGAEEMTGCRWCPAIISLALFLLFFELTSGPGCLLPFYWFFLPFLGSSVVLMSLTGIIHDYSHSLLSVSLPVVKLSLGWIGFAEFLSLNPSSHTLLQSAYSVFLEKNRQLGDLVLLQMSDIPYS